MSRCALFKRVEAVDQWIGNLFYRNVSTAEIKQMNYRELKYWNSWHEEMVEADKRAMGKK